MSDMHRRDFIKKTSAVGLGALATSRVVFCSGRDLCWYGVRSVDGIPRLRTLVDSLR